MLSMHRWCRREHVESVHQPTGTDQPDSSWSYYRSVVITHTLRKTTMTSPVPSENDDDDDDGDEGGTECYTAHQAKGHTDDYAVEKDLKLQREALCVHSKTAQKVKAVWCIAGTCLLDEAQIKKYKKHQNILTVCHRRNLLQDFGVQQNAIFKQ